MSEWIIGLICTVVGSLIGAALTALWDLYKRRQDTTERSIQVWANFCEEIKHNEGILTQNIPLLRDNIGALSKGQIMLAPLARLRTGSWDILAPCLLAEKGRLKEAAFARQASRSAEYINEIASSRETHRINNSTNSGYCERLSGFDQLLLQESEKLLAAIKEYLSTSSDLSSRKASTS